MWYMALNIYIPRKKIMLWAQKLELMLAIALVYCTIGCQSARVSMMVSVEDLGPQIATKNKYKLARIIYERIERNKIVDINENKLTEEERIWVEKYNNILKSAQPQTFGDDGMPFVLQLNTAMLPQLRGYWTGIFIFTLILPVCTIAETKEPSIYTIDVIDNQKAHETFTIYRRHDNATTLLPSPFPMLCQLGDASFSKRPVNSRIFTHHSIKFGDDSIMEYGEKIDLSISVNNVVAYGIAVRLKQLEDKGLIDASRYKFPQNKELSHSDDFEVVYFRRKEGSGHEYVFELKARSMDVSIRQSRLIQKELKTMISNDFAASFPSANRAVLVVDFPEYALEDGVIKGRALVMPLDIMALDYDKNIRTGIMKIRVVAGQLEEARKYLRRNIEAVVRDKNIALLTGEIPPDAYFRLLDERMKDGILEIKFKTE